MAEKQIVHTSAAPAAIGPYSQAVKANGFLFVSGQIALDAASGEMIDGDIEAQTRQALGNLRAVLEAGGAALADVVKCTIYLTTMDHFPLVNQIYGELFSEHPPARAAVAVAQLPKNALVEVDAIAAL